MAPLRFPGIHKLHKDFKNVALKNVFSALLLSKDGCSLYVAGKVFGEYGVELNTALSEKELEEKLRGGRFDLVVVDADDPEAGRTACLQPASPWNGISMLLRGSRSIRLENRRIHLTVPKPLTVDMLSRGVKAVYSAMARHRLMTYRHPVTLRLLYARLLHHGKQRPVDRATVLNLSQTGLCFTAPFSPPTGAIVSANLPLPESADSVNISGTVVWSDASGRAGLRFHQLSAFERRKLEEHLNPRLPWQLGLPA